ncbi:uncharacterized protein LOC111216370 [Seriola dumerili]|uniref:uncharacterized protein LOC111216370 n=1 Tax=Seriola dumerili TaxID=41447 RepID=UPI000BBE3E70|nr:uncharacterized protein LOC111216370 [Seriola dumerili]
MAGTVHMAMSLLLLSFITTGVKGQSGLTLAERSYDIKFPCEEDLVCFHLWQFSTWKTSRYFAIVSNGEIQTAESEEKKCTLQIKDLTAEDVGRDHCQQMPNNLSSHNTAPVLNLLPAKTVSLQCVALTYVDRGRCSRRRIRLTWVDEAGVEIQEDSYHQINQPSPCDITLTVAFQEPGIRKFRCQATIDEQVQTSAELWVRAPALRGKGKGFIPEPELEPQGGNQDVTGAAVGVVGCVVLTAVIAVFVVNTRRRRNSQLLDDPHSVQSGSNNVMNTDDVIYADIILPAVSDRVLVLECESTEYACVRYM